MAKWARYDSDSVIDHGNMSSDDKTWDVRSPDEVIIASNNIFEEV